MRSRGFALIELLVVIAVIALLMAILTPALRKAKGQARFILCKSNQRQVVIGVSNYAVDNNDKLPPNTNRTNPGNPNSKGWHLPYELNFYGNGQRVVTTPGDNEYHFVGKYLGPYLPDVKIFNCAVSPINPEADWPPPGAGAGDPVDSYSDLYLSGQYSPLHCTYMPFWNYQGYNAEQSASAFGHNIEGPTRIASKTKLLLQDSLFYKPNGSILFPGDPIADSQTWFSSHSAENSQRVAGFPFVSTPTSVVNPSSTDDIPEMKMNVAFSDAHVETFDSRDSVLAGCAAHISVITRKYGF